ncbi:hypothetical protein EAF07_03910 [Streptococcus hillyeri]|uniref:Uncharacterized protein n=1 Tax=Streptococcus hillyeri TaxID=2282420 RepID=A0A3L9DVM2_9STRE|nr:hypothetical protein EAF07_03910 [Streptococcus hillyeri]
MAKEALVNQAIYWFLILLKMLILILDEYKLRYFCPNLSLNVKNKERTEAIFFELITSILLSLYIIILLNFITQKC